MSWIGNNGCWKKTVKGWRYICNDDDQKATNRYWERSLKVASLYTTYASSTISITWECIIAYITSPTDFRNLAATCRFLHKLLESELGWSCLIRTKFGHRLWLRHVQQIPYRQNNPQINLYADIETMEEIEVDQECVTISTTFLLNRVQDQIMPVTRATLHSCRYHLETEVSKHTFYIAPSEYLL